MEREREREHSYLLVHCPNTHNSQRIEAKSQELNPNVFCGWQEPNYLNYHTASQEVGVRSCSQESSTDTPVWDVGILTSRPTVRSQGI